MPVVQLVALAIIGANGGPRVLLGISIPLIVVTAVLAAVSMDNIASVKNDTGAARDAAKDATPGSCPSSTSAPSGRSSATASPSGRCSRTSSAALRCRRPASPPLHRQLLGSLIRPVGGWLADRYGGARITLWNFVAMAGATGVIVVASTQKSLPLFTIAFIALFVLTGLGNGSTYKMIPGIFQAKAVAKELEGEAAASYGRRLSGASMGLIGAVGALGGVGINLAFRQSFLSYGSGTGAFVAFLAFYALCFLVTWAVYLRGPAARPVRPLPQRRSRSSATSRSDVTRVTSRGTGPVTGR